MIDTCEFCEKEKKDFSGVAFGKRICNDCATLMDANDTKNNEKKN